MISVQLTRKSALVDSSKNIADEFYPDRYWLPLSKTFKNDVEGM